MTNIKDKLQTLFEELNRKEYDLDEHKSYMDFADSDFWEAMEELSTESVCGKVCVKCIDIIRTAGLQLDLHPNVWMKLYEAVIAQCEIIYFG